jgi:DNA-directed RNA polymerase subunit F
MEQNKKFPGIAEEKLKGFALYLVKQKKFEGLDQATFDMLVDDVYDRLEERVNAVILVNIPPEKVEELDNLLALGNKEELSDFTSKNVPDLEKVITEALVAFEKTYLGV